MNIPFVLDNQQHGMADALNELLTQTAGKPLDIATAYFAVSGYRLVKDRLHQGGTFRLLLGAEPHTGADVGLRPNAEALKKRLQGYLEAEPFNEAALKLVEELIAFLRADKVEVRLYNKGFLHAKAYLFHQDHVGPHNKADRMCPFAAIVGSSNFTGPGLVGNKELNLVHRVILPSEQAVDWEAAERTSYLEQLRDKKTLLDPSGTDASGKNNARGEEIDVLISTDVLSEGQNLQDCGILINYDLTWNPIRLVQRNGRIDRIGSPHADIAIHNMFPEEELEVLLHLIERLTNRIFTIDDLGLLDASILGEVVHPRTFNTIRRIRKEDGAVLDEEEARAELAGPEMLLKQLKDLLNRDGANVLMNLPNGIHSGLHREKCYGMFFYFQAPRSEGEGKRHFCRYIDARTHEVQENRYEIAQRISCLPDEPRYIGNQDVFVLQDEVIEHILAADREAEAKAAAPTAVDPIQQTVSEEIKDAIRHRTVDREYVSA